MISLDHNCIRALLPRAKILLDSGDAADALLDYERILQIDSRNIEALTGKANILYESGRTQDALAVYDQITQISPTITEAWLRKAELLEKSNSDYEALTIYNRLLELSPDNIPLLFKKLEMLSRWGVNHEALSIHESFRKKIIALHKKEPSSKTLDNDQKALEIYRGILLINPEDFDAWIGLSKLYLKLDELERALKAIEQALQINPTLNEARDIEKKIIVIKAEKEVHYKSYLRKLFKVIFLTIVIVIFILLLIAFANA